MWSPHFGPRKWFSCRVGRPKILRHVSCGRFHSAAYTRGAKTWKGNAMPNDKKKDSKKQPLKPLKPKNPHTEGAPDDKDRNAQYEDKDES
jgi:hypothetical protein